MTDTLETALSAEEWRLGYARFGYWGSVTVASAEGEPGVVVIRDENSPITVTAADRARIAAFCLYGQPFGFTQEDVRWVKMQVYRLADTPENREKYPGQLAHNDAARSLAARIAALLPPTKEAAP